MADVRVTCVQKTLSTGRYEHITHLGGPRWLWTVAQVIESIERRTNTFYVVDDTSGKRAEVGVVKPSNGRAHVRTYADGLWNDNLLSLPSCNR